MELVTLLLKIFFFFFFFFFFLVSKYYHIEKATSYKHCQNNFFSKI